MIDTSHHVYIRSPEYAWLPARLLERDGDTAQVSRLTVKDEASIGIINSNGISGNNSSNKKTLQQQLQRSEKQSINLNEYPNRAFPLQNVDRHGNLKEVDDMVELPFLHEVSEKKERKKERRKRELMNE
jgi:hypothetical protein